MNYKNVDKDKNKSVHNYFNNMHDTYSCVRAPVLVKGCRTFRVFVVCHSILGLSTPAFPAKGNSHRAICTAEGLALIVNTCIIKINLLFLLTTNIIVNLLDG